MGEKTPEWLRIGVDGVVPVEWELSKDDAGEISGLASVYGNIDVQDDVVMRGAFNNTIAAWKSTRSTLPLVLDHQHNTDGIIGSITTLEDTAKGLKFAAKFSSVAKAQDARTKAREGHLRGVSIYGPILAKSFESRNGREVRLLHDVGLVEISLTGFPANNRAMVSAVKAVSNTPWSQFSEADYSIEQWRKACLIDTGQGDVTAKSRYKLPVREPSGSVNRNGVHAAAGALAGSRGGLSASPEQKKAAAIKLVALYRSALGENPPDTLLSMAGMATRASLTFDDRWVDDMRSALAITSKGAQEAAVAELIMSIYSDVPVIGIDDQESEEIDDGEKSAAVSEAARYAVEFLGEGESGAEDALAAEIDQVMASVEVKSHRDDLAALMREIHSEG